MTDNRQHVTLAFDGFSIDDEKKSVRIRWPDINGIIAYKYDLFAVDEICLLFNVDDMADIEISEEAHGFSDLMTAMETQLEGLRANWFNEVMVPAFAECRAVIYKRLTPSPAPDTKE